MGEDRSEVSVTTPAGGVGIKSKNMAELISVAAMICLVLLSYVLWEHKNEARASIADTNKAISDAFRELAATNKAMVEAQREMNCLIAMPQDRREAEFRSMDGLCKRISR